MKKLFNSLRSRIILCILLTGLVPVLLLHNVIAASCRNALVNRRSVEIRRRIGIFATSLSVNDDIDKSLTESNLSLLHWYSEAYGGRILVIDEQYRIVFDSFDYETGRTCVSDAVFRAFQGNEYKNFDAREDYLEFVLPVIFQAGEEKEVIGALIFSSTTAWLSESVSDMMKILFICEIIWVCIVVFLAVYISYLIVRPVNDVTKKIDLLNEGHMDVDLETIDSYREVDNILDASAQVVRHYKDMEESQEQFVSNVSHELRTPMTSIRVLSDSLVGQQDLPEEVYQEFLSDISVEIERENNIIEDLLSMVRLGKASDAMNITHVNMNEFVLAVMQRIKPIAEERKIDMIYESFRQVSADIDEIKLGQAFTNLIENAVKYNHDEGYVKVSLDADHEYFYLRVQDNGVGIPEDALEHIFDRFYRVDKARSRETGGTGLGLSITKSIILLHYGIIKAESISGQGSTFTVRIPLTHVNLSGGRS